MNGTPSQDSPSSTESGAPVNELTKNTISPDSLAFPTSPTPYAISADPGSSPHPNPIRARSITAREIDLLDSLYEMLVGCANRTDTRALQRIEAQSSTLRSHGGTISGQKTAQKPKITTIARKRESTARQSSASERERADLLSLFPHYRLTLSIRSYRPPGLPLRRQTTRSRRENGHCPLLLLFSHHNPKPSHTRAHHS